jgi:hypothetical protein
MRYIMFVCVDPAGEKYVPEEDNIDEWVAEVDRRKVRLLGNRLKGPEDATTVRWRNGKVLVTDGPFAETKEWIAGFDLLECEDLDQTIEIASRHPMARWRHEFSAHVTNHHTILGHRQVIRMMLGGDPVTNACPTFPSIPALPPHRPDPLQETRIADRTPKRLPLRLVKSESTLPSGVSTRSARWLIAKLGAVRIDIRPGSSIATSL